MKHFKGIFILILLCMACGIFFLLNMDLFPNAVNVDTLQVNRLAHIVETNWGNLEHLNFIKLNNYDFIVLDPNGQLLYQSRVDLPDGKVEAVQAGMITWDVLRDEVLLGSIMVETQPARYFREFKKNYQIHVLIIFVCLTIFILLSFIYLYFMMIHPFIKLRRFATTITEGKLEEALPMDRHNLFGAFTESFDMMRTSLLKAQKTAIELDKSKKELVASLSHDIKTPVTSIKVVLELLQMKYASDKELQIKLSAIQNKSEQIEHLANNLLHSTLEDLDELAVIPSTQPSYELLKLLKKVNIDRALVYEKIPDCLIVMDLSRTEQVLENIIGNSRKYADTNIYVSFILEGGYLHVMLEDHGKGVKHEEIELVCNQYFRGEYAKASGKEGEGMGLYLARSMMRKMNGDLEAYHCNPGFGVRLLFLLS